MEKQKLADKLFMVIMLIPVGWLLAVGIFNIYNWVVLK